MKNLGVLILLAAGGYLVYRYMNPTQPAATMPAILPPTPQAAATTGTVYNAAEPAAPVAPAPVIVKPTPPIIPVTPVAVKPLPPVIIQQQQAAYIPPPVNTIPVVQPVVTNTGIVQQVSPPVRHIISPPGSNSTYGFATPVV